VSRILSEPTLRLLLPFFFFFAEGTSAKPSLVTWLNRQQSFTGRPDSQGSAIGLRTSTGLITGPPSVPRSLTHWDTLTSPVPVLTPPIRLSREVSFPVDRHWCPLLWPLSSAQEISYPTLLDSYSELLRSPVDCYLVLVLRNCRLAQASPRALPRLAFPRPFRLLITDSQDWVFNTDSPRLTLPDWLPRPTVQKTFHSWLQKTDWYRSSPNLLSLTGYKGWRLLTSPPGYQSPNGNHIRKRGRR